MEVQPSIRELIDPWTRIGYYEEIKPNLFTGEPELKKNIVFIVGGRAHSRYLSQSETYGDSILFKREWYSLDIETVKLDKSSDYLKQLEV